MTGLADLPVLYSFRRCPYAMRARMALLVSETIVRLREVVLRDKPDEMIAASPKATVPVLVLPDGEVIDESLAIMRWALGHNDPQHWLQGSDAEAALIAEADGPFKHHLDRYKYPVRYDNVDPLEHRAGGQAFLEKLDSLIQKSAMARRPSCLAAICNNHAKISAMAKRRGRARVWSLGPWVSDRTERWIPDSGTIPLPDGDHRQTIWRETSRPSADDVRCHDRKAIIRADVATVPSALKGRQYHGTNWSRHWHGAAAETCRTVRHP